MTPRHIAVLDLGKTNAKIALVDLQTRAEVDVATRPNTVLPGPPFAHFDTEGHWAFFLAGLQRLHRDHGVDAIAVTTHGACAALLAADGSLAAPVIDYEEPALEEFRSDYAALRPPFSETGAPHLPLGLNIGAQIHWQFRRDPGLAARVAHLVTWPQYWGFRLTGKLATDVTSLGCHTDLWNPHRGEFSGLVATLGLTGKIAPALRSGDVLGTVTAEIAAATGLPPDTPVACGIHDSNASLLPHLIARRGAFSVVSTGTWVIVMSIGGRQVTLDPARDTLVNVNARGAPVPSARFMGGREYELIRAGRAPVAGAADAARVLKDGLMLLPAVVPDCGPFPGRQARWTPSEPQDDAAREVALGYYLALMTAECLALTGGAGPAIIEGPFARNGFFLDMLAAATAQPVLASASQTGTAIGAALLFAPTAWQRAAEDRPHPVDPALKPYAAAWRALAR
jgi:sugar (pentulose or hexulose) kinase